MISIEKSKEVKIKRANTDWWINGKAIVADNGMTYIAYVTDMGEVHLKEFDAKCSRSLSRDVRVCTLNCNYADEHNAPSICVMRNGKIIIAYTGHSQTASLKYRITENKYDILSFGEEKTIPMEGSVTYVQLFENTGKNELWLFCRVNGVTWEFRYSKDGGETWSGPTLLLKSDAGGLFYLNVRKQFIRSENGGDEQWFFALYGHPRISKDHTIRSGIFNSDGQLLRTDGTETAENLYQCEGRAVMEIASLDIVYESPEGTTVRLLEVSPTLPLRVGFAPFVIDDDWSPDPSKPVYYMATFKGGKWNISEPICAAGEFLAKDVIDGSQTYLGGMACYYGVGEAGLYPRDIVETRTNRVYIARFDGENRVLESYLSQDHGKTYQLEQVIRKIPKEENRKIWRPIVPIHAQDNLPVYWHEGTYAAHTGGWHADVVMYVEYDD